MNFEIRFERLWNESPKKRYKHFVRFVADQESVWMLSNEDGFTTIDLDGYVNLLVWPSREFAVKYDSQDAPVEIEVHDFCQRCEDLLAQENVRFMVFPTDKNVYVVSTEELLSDILYELDLVE